MNKQLFIPGYRRSAFLLIIFCFLLLSTSTLTPDTIEQLYTCGSVQMTEAGIAAYRNITLDTLYLLRTRRGLTIGEICVMPEEKLARAIARAETPKPDRPDEAASWRLLQLRDENDLIPADGLSRAVQHVELMRAAQQQSNMALTSIGSNDWTWLGPGNIGGRIRSIVIHPDTPNRMWTGSVSGGIWHTTDGGALWQPVDDFMANLAVSTMVMDPNNPDVMYAGTGEGFYNIDAIRGAGVFKTTDGGVTWNQLGSTATSAWYWVNRLDIHPGNTQILLAATGSGIWRSSNSGSSWTMVNNDSDVKDVDFHPTNGNLAIASGSFGRAWYSTDGGTNWETATGLPALDWLGRVEVAYAPSNTSIVYASASQNNGEVWKSTDGGHSYSLINTGTSYLGQQGWYNNIVWIDPTNANTIIVGGIDLWRSTNGGVTLTKISEWWNAPASAHADHHAIVEHPHYNGTTNKIVYFGNDGGIYRTDNVYTVTGTTGWQELNNNLGITQFYGAAGNPTSGVIVGGTQDNGTLRYTGNSEGWTTMFGGDGGFSAADPTDPNYFYGEYVNLTIHRSADGGVTSSYIYDGIDDAWTCANFIAPFILDPNNSNTMLAGGCRLWRSTNVKASTPSWSAVKSSIDSNISAIVVASGNSAIVWAGHNNGNIYKSLNGTSVNPSWDRVDANSPNLPNRFVTRLAIDPNNHNVVYATFGGFSSDNIWRTVDGGSTWSDRTGVGATGLPNVPVRSLVIDPSNSNRLYVGTEVGVFASEDAGATWIVPQSGPANVSVDELFWMDDTLVAATHGRGLFSSAPVSTCNDAYEPNNLPGEATPISYNTSLANADICPNGDEDFYTFSGTAGDGVEIDIDAQVLGSALDSYVFLLDGNENVLAVNDDAEGSLDSKLSYFPLPYDGIYYVKVRAYAHPNVGGPDQFYTIHLRPTEEVPPPPNDDLDNATLITYTPYNNIQGTTGATTAADDPLFGCTDDTKYNSVWYQYTPPAGGTLSVNTFGSDYDTVLAIWSGTRGNLTSVGCNDDTNGLQSQVEAPVSAGMTYYIEIAGFTSGSAGSLSLSVDLMVPPPENDEFENALVIAGTSYNNMQSTWGSTTAPDDPPYPCIGDPRYNTVWYRYTSPSNGRLEVNTYDSTYDTVLAIWTGTQGNLTNVACNDDSNGTLASEGEVQVTGGTTYFIEIAGFGPDSVGSLSLSAMFTSEDSPVLSIPEKISAYVGQTVSVPVNFTSNNVGIASTIFSIDYDQICLTFDPSDSDQDSIPDAITFHTSSAFSASVTFDESDSDGELDFLIADVSSPLASLPDGMLLSIDFVAICSPPSGTTNIASLNFSDNPAASFGNTGGQSVPGTTEDGSAEIRAAPGGDCNGDQVVDAGDISALVLRIFEGDFPDNIGCDANEDGTVDAGDISCMVLIIFNGPGACTGGLAVVKNYPNSTPPAMPAPSVAIANQIPASPGGTVTVPITFSANGNSISSLIFSLDYNETWLTFDSTDSNNDGIPDAVSFNLPPAYDASVTFNVEDTDGELDFFIADLFPPLTALSDNVFAYVTFNVGNPAEETEAVVSFSQHPAASFGSTTGQSIPGTTEDGSVLITTRDFTIYLPSILRNR